MIDDFDEEGVTPSHPPRPRRVFDESILRQPIATLHPGAPVCVDAADTIAEAVDRMRQHRIGCVLVTERGHLVGIFTERDVLFEIANRSYDALSTQVSSLMTADPETLPITAPIALALNIMSLGGFRHVPLVDEEKTPVGVLSMRDVIDYLVELFPAEIQNWPPRPGLEITKDREGA
jgi:CBS domain-containing protein